MPHKLPMSYRFIPSALMHLVSIINMQAYEKLYRSCVYRVLQLLFRKAAIRIPGTSAYPNFCKSALLFIRKPSIGGRGVIGQLELHLKNIATKISRRNFFCRCMPLSELRSRHQIQLQPRTEVISKVGISYLSVK